MQELPFPLFESELQSLLYLFVKQLKVLSYPKMELVMFFVSLHTSVCKIPSVVKWLNG